MKSLFLILSALLSLNAFASETVSFTCSATSTEATASGQRFAYQLKGLGYRSHGIPNSPSVLTGSASSLDVYQIAPNGTVVQVLKNGKLEDLSQQSDCAGGLCALTKTLKAVDSQYGLILKTKEYAGEQLPDTKYRTAMLSAVHQLSPTTVSKAEGSCQIQSSEIYEEFHGSDVIEDASGHFILVPRLNGLPVLLSNTLFSTRLNDVPDEDGNVGPLDATGGFISATARNPRTGKVAIAVQHLYRLLSAYTALYVYDPATGAISTAPYQRNGRSIPANTSDALSFVSDLSYDSSGLLHAFAGDAAGNRFQYSFSTAQRYLNCRVLERVELPSGSCESF